MKKIIKFRGARIDNGAIVSGKDFKSVRGDFFISDGVNWFQVIPDSVAQFVGYDKTGAEIYEGDVLQAALYEGFTADFNGVWLGDDFFTTPIENFKLKKV